MGSSKSNWEGFFKEAGIPSRLSTEYASIFCDNRMRLDMLEALDKEVLQDLGVKAVGDIIAILRHAKIKQKELSRQRSSSPEVQVVSKKPSNESVIQPALLSTNSSHTKPAKAPTTKLGNISMTVKADGPSKSTTTSKPARRTLSERFGTYEKEAKIKKTNEEEIQQLKTAATTNLIATSKQKAKTTTVFTIQLPSKKPSTSTLIKTSKDQTEAAKETNKQSSTANKPKKVTLVPAQGKTLNRNKQSTSIFDRLDRTSSSSSANSSTSSVTKNKTVTVRPKQDVFSRLGDSDEFLEPKSSNNVFSRLGEK